MLQETSQSAPQKITSPGFLAKKSELVVAIDTIGRNLEMGTSGNDVLILQDALMVLGYMTALPNGNFGPETEDALIRFKVATGLSRADDRENARMAGPRTKAKMQELLRQSPDKKDTTEVTRVEKIATVEAPSVKKNIAVRQHATRKSIFPAIIKGSLVGFAAGIIGISGGLYRLEKESPGSVDRLKELLFPWLHDDKNPGPQPSPHPSPNPLLPPAPPQENKVKPPETTDQKVEKLLCDMKLIKKLEESTVVLIFPTGKNMVSQCAGFIIDDRTIVTARHCLMDEGTGKFRKIGQIFGLKEGGRFDRRVQQWWPTSGSIAMAADGDADFGVIHFNKPHFKDARILKIANHAPTTGEAYAIMGHPLSSPWKIEAATFDKMIADPRGQSTRNGREVCQMNGETHGGNSGGPVTNAAGEVIGVAVASTMQFSDQRSFVLPIDKAYVRTIIAKIDEKKNAPSGKKKLHVVQKAKGVHGKTHIQHGQLSPSLEALLKQLEEDKRNQSHQPHRWNDD